MPLRGLDVSRLYFIAVAATLFACGAGDGGQGPSSTENEPVSITLTSGGGQTQRINTAVSTAPAVVVKDASGNPVPGVPVHFAVIAGGGSVTGADPSTDNQGIARLGSWTLGPAVGTQKLRATAQGTALQMEISATGRLPHWTVAVYMAADNSLAFDGVRDIEEMEAAVRDPEVQVFVQAEFSGEVLAQYGCPAPSCIGRPNFNTFQYFLTGAGTPRIGPNGPVTEIGNRDMTSPADLAQFIQSARSAAPSEGLLLVLWNHGGGYVGLLGDQTSAPQSAGMSMLGLKSALQQAGGPPIDVIDFDMCLMAGYETLITVQGLANYAVFSEEVTPAEGNEYTALLNAMSAASTSDGAAVASIVADQFDHAFQGDRAPTTISAYDVTAFGALNQAISQLAGHLKADLVTFAPLVAQAASATQRFRQEELTDILNFVDSLETRVADPTIRSDILAVRAAGGNGGFRLRTHARNGESGTFGGTDVLRATGLHILLPDVTSAPVMAPAGPRSLQSYLAAFGTTGWGQFIEAYAPTTSAYTDLGTGRLETYLYWTDAAQAAGVDIDLWVLEPDGTIASPYFGSVSPNGTLTNDSYYSGIPVEGYLTNRFVMNGVYVWYAFLVDDPQSFHPQVDLAYRYGSDPFASIFGTGPYPQLTFAQSILADPDPTFGEANSGMYSDFVAVANATFGSAADLASGQGGLSRMQLTAAPPRISSALSVRGMPGVRPTQRQVTTLMTLLRQRRAGFRPIQARGLAKLAVPHVLRSGR